MRSDDVVRMSRSPLSPLRRLPVLLGALAVLGAASAAPAQAAPGELDPGFGTGGIVQTALNNPAFGAGSARDEGDRIVVAGTEQTYGLAVARYLAGGAPDTDFDGDGIATTPFLGFSFIHGIGVVLDAERRPIVLASAYDTGSFASVALVARYTSAGALDTGFGTGGRVILPGIGSPSGLGRQPDGRIVIAGASGFGPGSAFVAARLAAADGAVDAAYGGAATLPLGVDTGYANDATVDASGRALIAGTLQNGPAAQRYAVARFGVDGAPDAAFDGDGLAEVGFGGGSASTNSIAVTGDGRIVVAGDANDRATIGVARFTDGGAVDPSFDGDGRVTTAVPGYAVASATAVQVDAAGRVNVAAKGVDGPRHAFVLARYLADGAADGGLTVTASLDGHASSLLAQSTGRLVAAGSATPAGGSARITLVGYQGAAAGGNDPPPGFVPSPPARFVEATPPPQKWRIQGLEVTQGAQYLGVAQPDQAAGRFTTSYRGAKLARGGRTAVRVFVESQVPVYVELSGYSGITKLGTIRTSPTLIPTDVSALDLGIKQQYIFGAFQAELPREWARRTLRLTAHVVPETAKDACTAQLCRDVTLQGIAFTPVRPVKIRLVALTDGGVYPPAPAEALARTLSLIPQGENPILVPATYAGALEIGDLKVGTTKCTLYYWCSFRDRDETNPATLARLQDWDEDNPPANSSDVDITIGVAASSDIGISNGASVFPFLGLRQACSIGGVDKLFTCQRPVVAVSELVRPELSNGRPLTNAGHELFHALGRPHAGSACNSGSLLFQQSETWPPDETGRLNGVGFDFGKQLYGADHLRIPGLAAFGPIYSYFNVLPAKIDKNYTAAVGETDYTYDLMSYCGSTAGGGDPYTWVSPYNWDKAIDKLSTGKAGSRAAGHRALRQAQARALDGVPGASSPIGRRLEVDAIQTASGTAVTTMEDVMARAAPVADPGSVPHAVFRDASGATISDTPMQVRAIHGDAAGGATPVTMYRAFAPLPPSGVRSLAITEGGQVLHERRRSANPPTVAAIALPRVPLGRTARFTLRWRSGDRDGDGRQVSVQYAPDGRRFGTVFTGRDTGSAVLLFSALRPGARARFRVQVDDGFDRAAALSKAVRVPAPKPLIRVTGLPARAKAAPGAVLLLSATATDAGGVPVASPRLRWTVRGRRRAPGAALRAVMPKKGNLVLAVTAKGATGRIGLKRIVVRPARPPKPKPVATVPTAATAPALGGR